MMKYFTVCLFLIGFALGAAIAYEPPAEKTEVYNSPWLQDETGMKLGPRITLEPKP